MTGSEKYIFYVDPKKYDTVLAVNEKDNFLFQNNQTEKESAYKDWIMAGNFDGEIEVNSGLSIQYSTGFLGGVFDSIHDRISRIECNIYSPEDSTNKYLVTTSRSFSSMEEVCDNYNSEPCGRIYLPLKVLKPPKNLKTPKNLKINVYDPNKPNRKYT